MPQTRKAVKSKKIINCAMAEKKEQYFWKRNPLLKRAYCTRIPREYLIRPESCKNVSISRQKMSQKFYFWRIDVVRTKRKQRVILLILSGVFRPQVDSPSCSPDDALFVSFIDHVPDFFLIETGLLFQNGNINAFS